MPASGSRATGMLPCGLVAALSPYSFVIPGATNDSAAGFITSMMIATEMTRSSATCCGRIGASSSARTRIPAAACRICPDPLGSRP